MGTTSILLLLTALVLSGTSCFSSGRPLIVAHRGASREAPENTLAAMRLAFEKGADAVEADFRLTRDGKIVALHDASLKRTAGVDRPVKELTLAEVRALDVGRWKGARWKGEKTPLLSEILEVLPPGKRLFLEVKVGREILPELKRVLRRAEVEPERVAIITFSYDLAREAKKAFPRLGVHLLSSFKKHESGEVTPTAETLVRKARRAKLDGLDLDARGPLDEAFVRTIRKAGLELHVWTVNRPALASRMQALGVDSITTDRPARIREHLASTRDG
jgi:glycerophosphoryl diester phosphodiesterase